MSEKKSELEVRELAEKFFEEEISKLDDPQRKEEVELEKETYIGVWMLGYRAGESPAEQPVVITQERADFIREANGRDLNGIAEAGREESDAVEFAEWIEREGFWQSKNDKKWRRWTNELVADTTIQLYQLFKQRPAEWSGEKEGKV